MVSTQIEPGPAAAMNGARRAAVLLMLAYMMSFVDRQILVLMIEPLQRDLGINDAQFSLLHGTSFALFYTAVGLFVGGLIDRGSRVGLIAWAIALWSAATAVCGIATSYIQLFVARMMVGVGEAGLSPGAYSLLSDYFAPRHRTRAFAIYSTGIYLGSGLAFLVGGRLVGYLEGRPPVILPWLGSLESWRLTFVVVGLPGLLLALAIRFLIREPVRGSLEHTAPVSAERSPANTSSAKQFRRFVRSNWRAYSCHNLGFGLHMMFSYALTAWLPVILLRNYGWSITEVGLLFGLGHIFMGVAGTLAGDRVACWLRARGDASAELTLGAVSCAFLLASIVILNGLPQIEVAIGVAIVSIFFVAFPSGLNAASLQIVTPPHFRGQSGALLMLVGNLLGLGLGPLAVGLFTDFVFADRTMVGQSLQVVGLLSMPLAMVLLFAGRRYFRMHSDAGLQFKGQTA